MFRAGVLSIVVILAAGADPALLCRTRCDPQDAAASGCHHQGLALATASTIAGDDSCEAVVLGAAAALREEGQRGGSARGADHAVVVPRYHLADLTDSTGSDPQPARDWSLERRPLRTALRI